VTRANFWYEIGLDEFGILGGGNCTLSFVLSNLSANELEKKKSHGY
jgi:hypothetical protein